MGQPKCGLLTSAKSCFQMNLQSPSAALVGASSPMVSPKGPEVNPKT